MDSQAKAALGVKGNNYKEFFAAWIEKYSELENRIINACRNLPNISKFALDPTAEIEDVSQ